ncbi:DUF952 domain-containing protein [Paeniglutamicibacter sp. MACA_103]|uniref:DUF952 domain-containing protein n=1 Tax=Paeniglutamicibacter sp. MACA_103 TaxID=3377337 RepID=UPI003894A43A
MATILHLAELEFWDQAQATGVYRRSTRGATLEQVGFIHCSSPGQLPAVAGYIYADYPGELVVLELDGSAIAAAGIEIRFEDGGDGQMFPHLYGQLRTEWVRGVHRASMVAGVLSSPGLESATGGTS